MGRPRNPSNRFDVSGRMNAGTIAVRGAQVTIARGARLKARATPLGVQGTITVDTLAGHGLGITTAGRFDVRPGGTIKIDSDAPITLLRGTVLLATPNGCNEVQSPAITEEDPIRVRPAFVPAC